MSGIPTEPRQVMINIMYLVLTAMLALNVSAEIFNAFEIVEKGLRESNQAFDQNIVAVEAAIRVNAEKDPEAYQQYVDQIPEVKKVADDLVGYIDELTELMIENSGGYNDKGELKGGTDKSVTTRMLVDQGAGEELKAKIIEAREKFIQLVPQEHRTEIASKLTLNVDDESWQNAKDNRSSWSDFNFRQMPLKAVFPILVKFQNDAKSSESAVLNKYLEIIGGTDIVFDNYKVVSSPKKSYIILGETFESDVFMTATSKTVEGLKIYVNGSPLNIVDGVAKYSVTPTSTGIINYTAKVEITNPVTGEVSEDEQRFEYEVGQRSVSVSADKMNVLYIGVENPLTISAAGVSSNALNVSGTGGGISLTPQGGAAYMAKVTTVGEAKINISGGGLPPTTKMFRVKSIPDPVPMIGGQMGGAFQTGAFKAQQGIYAQLKDFDFDAKCSIVSFQLVYLPRGSDAKTQPVTGGTYNGEAKAMVNQAKPGDRYSYEQIRTRCPGDQGSRSLPSLMVNIQ